MSSCAGLPTNSPPPVSTRSATLRAVELCLVVAVVYALTGAIGLRLAGVFTGVSLFWPPAGIALAAVIRFGWRALPGVALGAAIVNLANANLTLGLWAPFGITVGNVAGTALGGWLATRRGKLILDRVNSVGYLVVAAVLGSVPAAIVGSVIVSVMGSATPGDLMMTSVVWWTGDMAGVLLLTPLLLWPPLATEAKGRSVIVWAGLSASVVFRIRRV